jgi:hypothetical protein
MLTCRVEISTNALAEIFGARTAHFGQNATEDYLSPKKMA